MWTTNRGTALTVIGENIHATRVVLRTGKYGTTTPDGRPAVRFADASEDERLLPLPPSVLAVRISAKWPPWVGAAEKRSG